MDKATRLTAQIALIVGLFFAATSISLAAKPADKGAQPDKGQSAEKGRPADKGPKDKGPNPNSVADVNAVLLDGGTSVLVTSTKELSNVVLLFCDMSMEKVEVFVGDRRQELVDGLWTATVSGGGNKAGAEILAVYVKSGSEKSGEGPGFGRRIDFDGACGGTGGGTGGGTDTTG